MDVDPNCRVSRRHALRVSLALGAGGACTGYALAAEGERPVAGAGFAPLEFSELAALWRRLVKDFVAGDGIDADYAARLASLLARLDPEARLPDYQVRNESKDFVAGPCWTDVNMAIVRFELKPGAVLTAHDHPPQVVVTTGIDGRARFRHFESTDPKPAHDSREPFRVRETRQGILEAGRTTALTRQRDWIHTFEAGRAAATIVDFTATLSDSDDWSYVEIGSESLGEDGDFEARWLGKNR